MDAWIDGRLVGRLLDGWLNVEIKTNKWMNSLQKYFREKSMGLYKRHEGL